MATFEKLPGSKVKLTIEVSSEQLSAATQEAYVKTRGKYNVPGFRKGKAPRVMIENMYGPLVFFDDAFDILYPKAYGEAVKEHSVQTVDHPEISLEQIEDGKPLVFSAIVAVKPEVKLGQYKGIEVLKREYNVTDEMVDREIDAEREKVARFTEVERPVENGDNVNLDYSGSVDGVKFDGGTAQGQELTIGSNTFIPGFEEQMIGMNIGEEKDLEVTFPEEYHAEELKGKKAVFAVKVNSIQVKELPEADDDFAKDVSEFDTIKEFRDAKRKELEERFKKNAEIEKENEAVSKVVENAEVEIPEAMVERQVDASVQNIAYRLASQGLSLQDYLKYTGTHEHDMRDSLKPEALNRVKGQLVLEAISKAENVTADEEAVGVKLKEYAERSGTELETFKKSLTPDDIAYFEDQVIVEKTLSIIMDNAIEKEADKAEKPAKKSTKKAAESQDGVKAEKTEKPAKKADEKAADESADAAPKKAAKKAAAKSEKAE
ncbi:MAG TPA: trigger factor [Clostridia bacterium]|nr:trigger factor [Clostridia bacterium]